MNKFAAAGAKFIFVTRIFGNKTDLLFDPSFSGKKDIHTKYLTVTLSTGLNCNFILQSGINSNRK